MAERRISRQICFSLQSRPMVDSTTKSPVFTPRKSPSSLNSCLLGAILSLLALQLSPWVQCGASSASWHFNIRSMFSALGLFPLPTILHPTVTLPLGRPPELIMANLQVYFLTVMGLTFLLLRPFPHNIFLLSQIHSLFGWWDFSGAQLFFLHQWRHLVSAARFWEVLIVPPTASLSPLLSPVGSSTEGSGFPLNSEKTMSFCWCLQWLVAQLPARALYRWFLLSSPLSLAMEMQRDRKSLWFFRFIPHWNSSLCSSLGMFWADWWPQFLVSIQNIFWDGYLFMFSGIWGLKRIETKMKGRKCINPAGLISKDPTGINILMSPHLSSPGFAA